ncbi:hypothetical protein AN958_05789 [Leucoagaricus sp. SymC.cos]|nr:hypothetical protein AN958_05789 [Leucoagaricus sp. SymC.cos]
MTNGTAQAYTTLNNAVSTFHYCLGCLSHKESNIASVLKALEAVIELAAGLTPHAPRTAPRAPIQTPEGTLTPASYKVPTGAEPGLVFTLTPAPHSSRGPSGVPPGKDIPTTDNSHNLVGALNDISAVLNSWGDKPWVVGDNRAHIALKLGQLVGSFISKGWHKLPFFRSGSAGPSSTLKGVLESLVPRPPLGPQTCGSAESADPAPPPPSSMCAPPSEATARPLAPCPQASPRPPRSLKHPAPSSAPASKRSYANTVHDITALVNLAKTVPDLPSDHIIAMHQASVPPLPSCRKLKTTVAGPSQHQVLIKTEAVVSASVFPSLVGIANRSLAKVNLWVDSCVAAYRGISLLTSQVASPEEIQVIAAAIHQHLGQEVQAALPASQSYLKIVDVPYFCPRSKDFIDSGYVREVMRRSHMASSFCCHAKAIVFSKTMESSDSEVEVQAIAPYKGKFTEHTVSPQMAMQVDDKGAPQLQTVTNDSDAPSPADHDTAEGSSQIPPLLFCHYSKPSLNNVLQTGVHASTIVVYYSSQGYHVLHDAGRRCQANPGYYKWTLCEDIELHVHCYYTATAIHDCITHIYDPKLLN